MKKYSLLTLILVPMISYAHNNVNVYGEVNRALLWADDGHEKNLMSVDNYSSPTKLGAMGDLHLSDETMAKLNLEIHIEAASTNTVSQLDRNGTNNITLDKGKAFAALENKRFGTLSLGYGSMSSDHSAEQSVTNSKTISYAAVSDIAGGLYFHQKDSTSRVNSNDPTVKDNFFSIDGLGTQNRIRYDSPRYCGLGFSTSYGQENTQHLTDAALNYGFESAGYKFLAAIAYAHKSHNGNNKVGRIIDGSISGIHNDSGIHASAAYGKDRNQTAGRHNRKFYYLQLGKLAELTNYGNTNFMLDFFRSKHSSTNDDKSRSYSASVLQSLDKINSEVYLGVRVYKYKTPATNYDNILAGMTGIRILFNA